MRRAARQARRIAAIAHAASRRDLAPAARRFVVLHDTTVDADGGEWVRYHGAEASPAAVAEAEACRPEESFSQIADEVSLLLARYSARAHLRRQSHRRVYYAPASSGSNDNLWLAAGVQQADQGETSDEDDVTTARPEAAARCPYRDIHPRGDC